MIRKALFGNSYNWSLSSSSYDVSEVRDTFYGSSTSFSWPNCSWMFSSSWSSSGLAWSWNWSGGVHTSWDWKKGNAVWDS